MHWVFDGCMTDDWLALMEFWKGVFQMLESLISILGLDQVCFGSDLDRLRLRGVTGTHEECEEILEEWLGRFGLDI